jgi:hypothetical protein
MNEYTSHKSTMSHNTGRDPGKVKANQKKKHETTTINKSKIPLKEHT